MQRSSTPDFQSGDRRFKSGWEDVTEKEIKEIFRSKMEELCFQSTGNGVDKRGDPMTAEGFWLDASDIADEALDALLALRE